MSDKLIPLFVCAAVAAAVYYALAQPGAPRGAVWRFAGVAPTATPWAAVAQA